MGVQSVSATPRTIERGPEPTPGRRPGTNADIEAPPATRRSGRAANTTHERAAATRPPTPPGEGNNPEKPDHEPGRRAPRDETPGTKHLGDTNKRFQNKLINDGKACRVQCRERSQQLYRHMDARRNACASWRKIARAEVAASPLDFGRLPAYFRNKRKDSIPSFLPETYIH
jgi:hypothetical protein